MSQYNLNTFIAGAGLTDTHSIERFRQHLENSLNVLFKELNEKYKIREIHWGHADPVNLQIEKIAKTNAEGTVFIFSRKQVGIECIRLIQPIKKMYDHYQQTSLEKSQELCQYYSSLNDKNLLSIDINFETHYLFLREISEEDIQAPFYQLRISSETQLFGGIGLAGHPDFPLNSSQLKELSSNRTLFSLSYLACVQLWSLYTFANIHTKQTKNSAWNEEYLKKRLIGSNTGLKNVFKKIKKVAPYDVSVLIQGESGTGKEEVARAIHQLSPRFGMPFVAVNCTTLPPQLVESELFGYNKGAFTGANNHHIGYFERANGGTLFLDEIGELNLENQVKILRALEERVIERIGGNTPIPIDIRVITATNGNLAKLIQDGKFRLDLYYRIKHFLIDLLALRERKDDIPALANYFLKEASATFKIERRAISSKNMELLKQYSWPGNIRELKHLVEEALINSEENELNFQELLPNLSNCNLLTENPTYNKLQNLTKEILFTAVNDCRGKIDGPLGAAQLLGINPNTLRSKLKVLTIPYGKKWRFDMC